MLEQLTYINHLNESLDFGKGKLFVNENDLRNYAWSIMTTNNRVSGFKKEIIPKTLPIILKVDTVEEGVALRNRIFEVFEKDVLAVKHGKIIIGDYYLKCYITESTKSDYLIHKGYMRLDVKVSTDFPLWVKEDTTVYFDGARTFGGKNLDYNRDYKSDYSTNLRNSTLTNSSFMPSNFKMIIHGNISNPVVIIKNHIYGLKDITIENGEYLTIDSTEKTIVLTHSDGSTENCFSHRDKSSYIFEKVPAGLSSLTTATYNELGYWQSEIFRVDMTVYDERSEPKWT